MKKNILVTFAVITTFVLSSCSKLVIVPDNYPVAGSWILTDASQSNGYGWQHFNTGLENGVFDFYSNGAAQYDDGYAYLKGNWAIRSIYGGYYDRYGNYYTDTHNTFEVHVYNGNNFIDLYFDDVLFTGNQIIATNYNGYLIERYVFSRY